MSLIRYGSYPTYNLPQQLSRMFDQMEAMRDFPEGLGGGTFAPAMDVKEDANGYTVLVEVPGVEQDDLSINLENNVLTLSGSKQQAEESETEQYRRIERSYGSFTRALTLPRNVDTEAVTANLADGVLTIHLPKSAESKPRQINIGATVESRNASHASGTDEDQDEAPQKVEIASDDNASGDNADA